MIRVKYLLPLVWADSILIISPKYSYGLLSKRKDAHRKYREDSSTNRRGMWTKTL